MVTAPLSAIFINALKSLKFSCEISIGGVAVGLQAVNRLKPISRPPLASDEVRIKDLLLNVIDGVDIIFCFSLLGFL